MLKENNTRKTKATLKRRFHKMKKRLSLVFAALMALSMIAGCGASNSKDAAKDTSAAPATSAQTSADAAAGTVSTDGSTSMEKVIGALGESFMQNNKGVTFTYNPTGSGSGITAVSEGRCDIGLSSRSLKDEEKKSGLKETTLALDGIAIIVNPQNKVEDLDIETIGKIYTGEIKNWKEVGGDDAEIVLIGREAGSGTRDGFESITKTEDKCKYGQELTSTGDVITTVSQNPNAIGYASLAAVKDNVKALSVGKVKPTEETVKDGSYVVQRPFVLVTKEGKALSDTAQKFFDYVTSADASQIISDAGAVPVK
jgi:phosphate transport system substrate-binding protein